MARGIIYIVGMMGAGKTAVGRRLAETTGRRFVDLDEEIENRAGMTIAEIFCNLGEAHFRQLEKNELVRASGLSNAVVAVGGGAYCSTDNQTVIDGTGVSVWLDAPVAIMFDRCCDAGVTRPLYASMGEMSALLERRRPYYEKAQLRVEVGSQTVEELAKRILSLVSEV